MNDLENGTRRFDMHLIGVSEGKEKHLKREWLRISRIMKNKPSTDQQIQQILNKKNIEKLISRNLRTTKKKQRP